MTYKVVDITAGSDLDYYVDWTSRLDGTEAIVSSVWAKEDSSVLTLHDNSISGSKTKVFIKDGTLGEVTRITNTIVTSAMPPRTLVCRFYVRVIANMEQI